MAYSIRLRLAQLLTESIDSFSKPLVSRRRAEDSALARQREDNNDTKGLGKESSNTAAFLPLTILGTQHSVTLIHGFQVNIKAPEACHVFQHLTGLRI